MHREIASAPPTPQPKPLALRTNLAWSVTGNALYAAAQWGILVLLGKFGTPEMLGRFALGLAVTAPVFLGASLRLRAVLATDVSTDFDPATYWNLRWVSSITALALVGAIAISGGFGAAAALVIVLTGLAKAVESESDLLYGLFQRSSRMDTIAVSLVLRSGLSLAAVALALAFSDNAAWTVAGIAISWALVLAAYDLPMARRFGFRWAWFGAFDTAAIRAIAWQTAPLGIATLLTSLYINIPRYFLQNHRGERELGIFAALASLTTAGNMAISALADSASPKLAELLANADRTAFARLFGKLLAMATVAGLAGIAVAAAAGEKVLLFFFRREYAGESPLLTWMMVAGAVSYIASLFHFALIATRRFRANMLLLVIVCLATAVGCALLVPSQGNYGAVKALLCAVTIQALGGALVTAQALVGGTRRR